jgi:hypothetical protein
MQRDSLMGETANDPPPRPVPPRKMFVPLRVTLGMEPLVCNGSRMRAPVSPGTPGTFLGLGVGKYAGFRGGSSGCCHRKNGRHAPGCVASITAMSDNGCRFDHGTVSAPLDGQCLPCSSAQGLGSRDLDLAEWECFAPLDEGRVMSLTLLTIRSTP